MLHKYRKTALIDVNSSVEHQIHVGDWIVGKPPFPTYVIADDVFQSTYERCD